MAYIKLDFLPITYHMYVGSKIFSILFFFLLVMQSMIACRLGDNSLKGSSADSIGSSLPVVFSESGSLTGVATGDIGEYTITLENQSGSPMTELNFPSLSSPFAVSVNQCSDTLQTGSNCSFTITYTSSGQESTNLNFDLTYKLNGSGITKGFFFVIEGVPNTALVLQSLYPANGANWNDYVRRNGASNYDANDNPCNSGFSIRGYRKSCIHGGEIRKIDVTQFTSCSQFSIRDALGVFDWICDDSAAPPVKIYSVGLKDNKNLFDLVNVDSWKSNQVVLTANGKDIYTTPLEKWWSNKVLPVPNNSGGTQTTLTNGGEAAGRIYVVDGQVSSAGYYLSEPKMALVTTAGSKLTKNGTTTELVKFDQSYTWISGTFDGDNVSGLSSGSPATFGFVRLRQIEVAGSVGVSATSLRNSLIENIVANGVNAAIALSSGLYNQFENIKARSTANTGIAISNSAYNRFLNLSITASNTCLRTISVGYGGGNVFSNVRVYGCSYSISDYMSYNTYTNILIANSATGLDIEDNSYSTFSHITSVASNTGVYGTYGATDSVLNQIVSVGNSTGMALWSGGNSTRTYRFNSSQMVLANNINLNFNFIYTDDNFFTNLLMLGSTPVPTPNCMSASNSTNPGLAVSGTDCVNQNLSDSTIVNGIDASDSFVGVVSTTDPLNSSNTDGVEAFANISDWHNFSNEFRVWGKNDNTFPSETARGVCGSGSCQIWDWRLKSTDNILRNRSFDGVNLNQSFVAGNSCPAAVHGNKTMTGYQKENPGTDGNQNAICEVTENCEDNIFLINAVEVFNDDIGDDDGLCESNEACIYSPNFGAYQGEGNYLANGTCTFQDGVITGVTMYAYPTNGG